MCAKVNNKNELKNSLIIPGFAGRVLSGLTMKVAGFDKFNEVYKHISQYEGVEFATKLIEYLGITINLNEDTLANIPKEGPVIFTANHPFGALDGMAALSVLGKVRPDLKILTNLILAKIPNTKENFIAGTTTYGFGKIETGSISGFRAAEEHLTKGGALLLFPAGEVSTYNTQGRVVEDKQWYILLARQIRKSGAPVIPVYFHGHNSKYFQFLSKISTKLSDLRLTNEMLDKKGKEIKMRVGSIINTQELDKQKDDRAVAHYLRSRSYMLEADVEEKDKSFYTTEVIPPVDIQLLLKDLENNQKDHLFDVGDTSCYLLDKQNIPNLMREIARKREEAFRAVGEGTNLTMDTDSYDDYYKHLILWNTRENALVGAYRLGMGQEILKTKGIHGFYADMLFRYSDTEEARTLLSKCVELGRSFVSVEHQKDTLALMLLFKGLLYSMMRYPEYRYLIGPVSISSWYPMLYRSIMVKYLKENHSTPNHQDIVSPVHPFVPDFGRVDVNALLYGKTGNLETFDRFLLRMSGGQYRLPALVKKYIKMGAKIIDYNVDPDFHDCLDGLILLALEDLPTDEIDTLSKDFADRTPVYRRFYGANL